ncbi:MAG: FxsA family protein [Paracoccaceae bacterium]
MRLIAALIAVPLIEIALFVTVGGWLGLWLTLLVVIGTGILGVLILRRQGAQAMAELRRATTVRPDALGSMADGALIGLAAVLLILPGFLTDTLGLLLLVPPLRNLLIGYFASRVHVSASGFGASARRSGPEIIDGEFFEVSPDAPAIDPANRPPSGWTRH